MSLVTHSMGHSNMGVLFMSVISKIHLLIDKHQTKADNYHRAAEEHYNKGEFEESVMTDKLSHPHEIFASELRMVLDELR